MISGRLKTKEANGFTLVEMVISVAFLSIISVVLLQLFVTANNLERKAHDLDRSVYVTKKVVAAFKACETPEALADSPLLDSAARTDAPGEIMLESITTKIGTSLTARIGSCSKRRIFAPMWKLCRLLKVLLLPRKINCIAYGSVYAKYPPI